MRQQNTTRHAYNIMVDGTDLGIIRETSHGAAAREALISMSVSGANTIVVTRHGMRGTLTKSFFWCTIDSDGYMAYHSVMDRYEAR